MLASWVITTPQNSGVSWPVREDSALNSYDGNNFAAFAVPKVVRFDNGRVDDRNIPTIRAIFNFEKSKISAELQRYWRHRAAYRSHAFARPES